MTIGKLKRVLEDFDDDTIIGYESDEEPIPFEVEWYEEYEGDYLDEGAEKKSGKIIMLF